MGAPAVPSVRMYRNGLPGGTPGGLGDCFLLTLPGPSSPLHLLIDCGLFLHSQDIGARLSATINDVYEATGGHLHAVVLTHQHYDHLSGFILAFDEFQRFRVDEAWLAWTEDPTDALAKALRRGFEERGAQLRAAVHTLEHVYAGRKDRLNAVRRLNRLLAFGGDGASDVRGPTMTDVMARVAAHVTAHGGRVRYLRPGETWLLSSQGSGSRVYVLGPPRNPELLRRSDPSAGPGREVYLSQLLDHTLAVGTRAGVPTPAPPVGAVRPSVLQDEPPLPFDRRFRVALKEGIQAHYPAYARKEAWRRLDSPWIDIAVELALRLDQDTNNTSLVLAFELSPNGDVLLFPGDAQVGNWLSWFDLHFSVTDTGQTQARAVDACGLLGRTSVYKVGHHGSHNATLRAQGLELMGHPELVAMIPVDEAFARSRGRRGHGWAMPYPEMYDALLRRTGHRVLRADQSLARVRDALRRSPDAREAGDRWAAFQRRVTETPLYFEYRLTPEVSNERPRRARR